jgi:RAD50-interacting protein 1
MIIQQVCGEIEAELKVHFTAILSYVSVFAELNCTYINETNSPKPDSNQPGIALSQTLLGPIALLSSHLSFLRTTLPRTVLITLYRRIASRISEHILHREIMYRGRHRITASEGKAIAAECELWVETCQAALVSSASRNTVEAPWLKLLQGGRLVGLESPELRKALDETFGPHGDEAWEAYLLQLVGVCEFGRDVVGVILNLRE